MIEAPISTPPQAYMDIISPMIDKALGFLEAGEKLQAMAFVGNLTTKEVIPVMIQTGSGEDKDQSARTIQSLALALRADFGGVEDRQRRPRPSRSCWRRLSVLRRLGTRKKASEPAPLQRRRSRHDLVQNANLLRREWSILGE